MRRIAACGPALAALLGAGSAAGEPPGADLLIQHARVWDATGAPVREGVSIRVRGGRIDAIGPDLEANGSPVLDAQGATAIPGLVDAHVHLDVVSGSELRGDPPEERVRLRHQHLRAYLACGVTTVLDTATPEATVAELRAWLAAGNPGPRWLTLGPAIPAPGGYMAAGFPAPASPADLPPIFAAIERAGAVGIKVPIEKGFGPIASWPIHTPEMRAAIAKLEVGKRADLVLVTGDPLRDVRALRSLRHVVQNGVARIPEGWMRE